MEIKICDGACDWAHDCIWVPQHDWKQSVWMKVILSSGLPSPENRSGYICYTMENNVTQTFWLFVSMWWSSFVTQPLKVHTSNRLFRKKAVHFHPCSMKLVQRPRILTEILVIKVRFLVKDDNFEATAYYLKTSWSCWTVQNMRSLQVVLSPSCISLFKVVQSWSNPLLLMSNWRV